MAFAITQNCCNDASCLSVCPVNCIHPTPDEPDFGKTDLLYIDPRSCIDCGACADACPVDAITRVSRLSPAQAIYADLNADYYRDRPVDHAWGAPTFPPADIGSVSLRRVAVVGTGPAACYTATALLRQTDAEVTFFDKLPVPGGLARYGVAPDHTSTRRIGEHFRSLFVHSRVTMRLGVEVGVDVTAEELSRTFDAVVYAVGADQDRQLPLESEVVPVSARTLVGWYTGHPDVPADAVDLRGVTRVVVIGNGNVALDAARILTAPVEDLVGTEISAHALAALRDSVVREVTVLGRRGPEVAAFTRSECQALVDRRSVPVLVAGDDDLSSVLAALPLSASASPLAAVPLVDGAEVDDDARRIVFSFGRAPVAVRDGGLEVRDSSLASEAVQTLPAELVLQATGYRGSALPGLPFDTDRGTVRNVDGRVVDSDDHPVAGAYVVGWAKRGATGGIGDNKLDAEQTVELMLADSLAAATSSRRETTGRRPLFGRTRR
ncbi:4Fe-4S binding protein [Rhodococcus sp. BP-349]|uniref:4Fe-4S binding protein n=1 Tax=unclassified Rhodococcus (in: high G+C Gram-positive bacteria) TaxID=192944 RepID=UPI001C9A76B2|nr:MULTISPECIES: 4Fe-4S binding protein [unclassified Rhodococcus (in: high G+C Gram-positive bacteria)]MBY6538501.1 4Fe-4S binding protein [Rhodococcus sp. BP-363]MBY6542838.1 4Fe-4S binding protein [Rhodococcus sp. BP-369]MBY6562068.1 4Fe-4S binding protein [Rhodococcus sp. BP-370]MBY6576360.1 4Fe-4S binding protein [Rhodococcus sp. BP-364]MBY6585661.1 4Fe-4S binding protein [Rhodococcus sp. BP-358]